MSWKRILAHIKSYHDCGPAIAAAIRIAKPLNARLTGLYTTRELAMLKLIFGSDHKAVAEAIARDRPLMDEAEAAFRASCEAAGLRADWDTAEGNASELLSLAGRCHDLIIVQQSRRGLDDLGTDIAEECAVASGVPTLIVPQAQKVESIGKRIIVAWNHSRQSVSALQGAMPLIESAEKVIVLLGQKRDLTSSVTKAPRHDIGDYLRCHAESVDVVPFEADRGDEGTKLLEAAHGARSDLIVMGAYGHSAWREFLLGGATRHVISNLDVPVLMAH